jgi:hypothetical protein
MQYTRAGFPDKGAYAKKIQIIQVGFRARNTSRCIGKPSAPFLSARSKQCSMVLLGSVWQFPLCRELCCCCFWCCCN